MTDDLVTRLDHWIDEAHRENEWSDLMDVRHRIEAQAAEIERLRAALKDLLQDTQHKDHDCGDEEWCPVIKARKVLEGKQ